MQKNGIKAVRESLGISQPELARRTRTSRQQIARLEDGQRKLTKEWAVTIGEALQCSPADLMFPEHAKPLRGRYRDVLVVRGNEKESQFDYFVTFPEVIILELLRGKESERLEIVKVNSSEISNTAMSDDYLLVERDVSTVKNPGLYQIKIGNTDYWRYLTPSITGKIIVKSDDLRIATETADELDILILGRVLAKLSAL